MEMLNERTIEQYRKIATRQSMHYSVARATVKKEKGLLAQSKQTMVATERAQVILQQIAQVVQRRAHKQIANVVTKCLTAVFNEKIKFVINFERKRGKTEASLSFTKNGKEEDPIDGSAGGLLDVAALALRLACLLLQRPAKRRVLVLDEPFRFINGEKYQENAGQLIELLSKEMKVQWIIVTDDPWLKIGKVIQI